MRCSCCDFKTDDLITCMPDENGKVKRLCTLCYETPAGVADAVKLDAQSQHERTLKTICYVGNAILKEIRALRPRNETIDDALTAIDEILNDAKEQRL